MAGGGWPPAIFYIAIAVVALLSALLLCVPPFASALRHRAPPIIGLVVALLSAPAMVLVDAIHKRWLRRRSRRGSAPLREKLA